MPCNCDYLEATQEEKNRQEVSSHIVYVDKKLKLKTDQTIIDASKDCYGGKVSLNTLVKILCAKIRGLSKDRVDEIIYNAYSKESRNLANWWGEHCKADKIREKEEKQSLENLEIRQTALKKLSAQERKVLGL